jgi:lipid II:glycine glycyltransferase (peptidoglycan interpeptide bridge formation enzyme)
MSERGPGDAWHFLQSDLWAEHKGSFGWHALRVGSSRVLTLSRRLPGGLVLTYVPYAPAFGSSGIPGVPGPGRSRLVSTIEDLVPTIAREVRALVGSEPTIVRFDLPQADASRDEPAAGWPGTLRRAPVDVQPPDTVVLDLAAGEDALLAAMHKKNRYNIRLAERKGVTVRLVDPADAATEVRRWYELYRETAIRDRITIHAPEYYERLLELARAHERPRVLLYLAEHEEDLLAGIIVVHHGVGATYLYGASSSEKRSLMPNYALQWRAIADAKKCGCAWYDLFGVPPAEDPDHPLYGLYRFKTGFGGRVVHRLGAWDVCLHPVRAGAYRLAERARDFYFHPVRRHAGR